MHQCKEIKRNYMHQCEQKVKKQESTNQMGRHLVKISFLTNRKSVNKWINE